jgi:hypothetical protein
MRIKLVIFTVLAALAMGAIVAADNYVVDGENPCIAQVTEPSL